MSTSMRSQRLQRRASATTKRARESADAERTSRRQRMEPEESRDEEPESEEPGDEELPRTRADLDAYLQEYLSRAASHRSPPAAQDVPATYPEQVDRGTDEGGDAVAT